MKHCLVCTSDHVYRAAVRENGLRGLKKLMMDNCFTDGFVEERYVVMLLMNNNNIRRYF